MDCILPGSSVHGIVQARILEWVAISSSRGFSWCRDWTQVSCIAGRFLPSELWRSPTAQMVKLSVYIYIIYFWFVIAMRFWYISYIHRIKLLILSFQLHFIYPTLVPFSRDYCFLISYFTSNCFMYTLTVYCGYRWFYYFCLLTSQLVRMDDFLPLLYVCSLFISELFHFIVFLFLIVAFSFLLRELL